MISEKVKEIIRKNLRVAPHVLGALLGQEGIRQEVRDVSWSEIKAYRDEQLAALGIGKQGESTDPTPPETEEKPSWEQIGEMNQEIESLKRAAAEIKNFEHIKTHGDGEITLDNAHDYGVVCSFKSNDKEDEQGVATISFTAAQAVDLAHALLFSVREELTEEPTARERHSKGKCHEPCPADKYGGEHKERT